MRQLGASEEDIARWTARSSQLGTDEAPFPLLRENGAAFRLFTALTTQWRRGPDGTPVGLDYAAIEPTARMLDLTAEADLFERLRVLEHAALEAFLEARPDG